MSIIGTYQKNKKIKNSMSIIGTLMDMIPLQVNFELTPNFWHGIKYIFHFHSLYKTYFSLFLNTYELKLLS